MKIVHVIGSLRLGGAETQLANLSTEQARRGHQVTIVLFDKFDTSLERHCAAHGVELAAVGIKKGSILSGIYRLYRTLRKISDRNTIIQTWMYGADLFVSLCSIVNFFSAGSSFQIFWNVRSTKFTGFVDFSLKRYLIALPCIPLSYIVPRGIICCAHTALAEHASWGFDKSKLKVIHNCFDESKFFPKTVHPIKPFTLGFVGRYDPVKNFPLFISMLDILLSNGYEIQAHVAGRGYSDTLLLQLGCRSEVKEVIEFKGQVDEMPDFYREIDLLLVTSFSEGFPNVICEAVLSGADCLSFDVGDVSEILPAENIIDDRSTDHMLEKIESRLADSDNTFRERLRTRVVEKFDIKSITDRYDRVYQSLV